MIVSNFKFDFVQNVLKCYLNMDKFQLERIDCRDPKLKIKRSNGYKQRRFLHFVRDAVYAVAYALHDMQRNVCGENWRGLCDKMRLPNEDIFQYLTKVSFKGKNDKLINCICVFSIRGLKQSFRKQNFFLFIIIVMILFP